MNRYVWKLVYSIIGVILLSTGFSFAGAMISAPDDLSVVLGYGTLIGTIVAGAYWLMGLIKLLKWKDTDETKSCVGTGRIDCTKPNKLWNEDGTPR
jgi:hypothetical protein